MISAKTGAPPIRAYRIVKRRFASAAFSGTGSRLHGGRWISPGIPLVYTSSSIALALLEWRAHLAQWPAPAVVTIEIQFDATLILAPPRLPKNWRLTPSPPANTLVGDNWFKLAASAVLKVPSAIVPDEFNYLLNPLHPAFSSISVGKPRPLDVDQRLGPLNLNPH